MSDQNTSLPLEFPTGAPARKETMSSLVVTHKALIADLETLNDPFDGEPVNAVQATLTVNPDGVNNSIDYTAVAYGIAGHNVSVRYTAPAQAELDVSVADNAITVACGTKHRMVITGTLSPDVTGTLVYAGTIVGDNGSLHVWSSTGTIEPEDADPFIRLIGGTTTEGDFCSLERYASVTWDAAWNSTTAAVFPDGLTFEALNEETGTPVVTAALPTAQQVIDAVEANAEASALVTVAANGTVTGAVAVIAATYLTCGVDGTPGKLGRTASDGSRVWFNTATNLTVTNNNWIELAQAT